MMSYAYTAIVTIAALLLYVWMGVSVGGARSRHGIAAPAMTGDPIFERHVRIQANTLEWLPIFLVSLWFFALSWDNDIIAAALGLVWIAGRLVYARGYAADPQKRSMGFMIQALAAGVLLFGALGRIIWGKVTGVV